MKVTTATVIGLLIGLVAGFIATGGGNMIAGTGQLSAMLKRYEWSIVVLSMLVPLADYLKGMRTTVTGSLLGHPFHQAGGFFIGLASGLGLFLVFLTKLI